MSPREVLLFVSPRFLFPVDSGGKIRTTQILRGLKGGRFSIRLASPMGPHSAQQYAQDLHTVCDEFVGWPERAVGRLNGFARLRHLPGRLPIPVATDYTRAAAAAVTRELQRRPSVVVFDFVHAAVLAPATLEAPAVLFTHNVEAEIFERHRQVAGNRLMRALWTNQHRKMRDFESQALGRFDVVVAVSERDSRKFAADYGTAAPVVIPTGVDLDFFSFEPPRREHDIVFCGSMDWLANQDGVQFFMEEVWPRIIAQAPQAKMTVVGRAPPAALVEAAARRGYAWKFTGFVDDVRPHMSGAAVSVIPLRIGGGTRLKVFESMAMGPAIVSTSIGVEGLPVTPGRHCIVADDAAAFAQATVTLLRDAERRSQISLDARRYVEANFGYSVAAQAFERACGLAIDRRGRVAADPQSLQACGADA